ncbi:unnamed protein product [Leptidea sinapis]|uniref:Kazal-like domain-containing protein n=1 Tax=Leptidea sinapis TaxID=189913 RepID=A0A5E4Q2G2_9NEOP|nr:unnamed protein product [Leptidea sinapis]
MPEKWVNRFKKPFSPAWMDWCDPVHCNDYHRIACGFNEDRKRFQWFQSGCHIELNNLCSTYRGHLKYKPVSTKYCTMYVMFLRRSCPTVCHRKLEPVCAQSNFDGHIALFRNRCAFEKINCRNGIVSEYEETNMDLCVRLII